MVGMHNGKRKKNTAEFKVGDIISLLISSVDRGLCDNKRLPCIMKEAKQKHKHILYILQSKFGILDQGYHAKAMEKYLGVLEIPVLENNSKISLRSAAVFASKHTTDLGKSQLMCLLQREKILHIT